MRVLSVLLFAFFIGCAEVKKVELSTNATEMKKVLKDVNKDDCLTLYYLFSGMAEYNSKYQGLTKNSQAFDLFKVVKQRYGKEDGWLDKKDGPSPNDLIESELLKLEMDKPQDFTEESRQKFVKLFEEFSEGALSAYKGK